MYSGKLNKRLTFQRFTLSSDTEGSTLENWTDLFKRWASVNINNASETFKNDQDFATRSGFILVRYDSQTKTLTSKDRFLYNGQYWEIVGVINMQESDEYLEIAIRRYGPEN